MTFAYNQQPMYCSQKYSGLKAVAFYACKLIELCPAVFCVARAVNKFYFRLVIYEHLTNGD